MLQVDREEVRLRRTIGLKKDEYHLDKKHITRGPMLPCTTWPATSNAQLAACWSAGTPVAKKDEDTGKSCRGASACGHCIWNCRLPVLFRVIMVRERMGSSPIVSTRAQEDGGDEPAGERGLLARQPLLRRAAGQGAPPPALTNQVKFPCCCVQAVCAVPSVVVLLWPLLAWYTNIVYDGHASGTCAMVYPCGDEGQMRV